ncbi:hypothetical protein PC128_g10707 [Phytophthora cactorum]|nr:hypothetical protein PC128_g10707 [Phytophthora cactorum]
MRLKVAEHPTKSKKHRPKPRREPTPSISPPTESVCVLEYAEGAPHRSRIIEVASPPREAASITHLPGLSWNNLQRDLKAGDIEQVCLITEEASVVEAVNVVKTESEASRPQGAEPMSAPVERFELPSWEALRESGDPVYDTAREYANVFPDKIPAEMPADRSVKHKINLTRGTKYCITRQWSLFFFRLELALENDDSSSLDSGSPPLGTRHHTRPGRNHAGATARPGHRKAGVHARPPARVGGTHARPQFSFVGPPCHRLRDTARGLRVATLHNPYREGHRSLCAKLAS